MTSKVSAFISYRYDHSRFVQINGCFSAVDVMKRKSSGGTGSWDHPGASTLVLSNQEQFWECPDQTDLFLRGYGIPPTHLGG